MNALYLILALAFWLLCFWWLFVLVMGLYRAWLDGHIVKWSFVWWISLPPLIIGYVVDLVSNWTIAVLVFQEIPQTALELVTTRLTRYLKPDYPDSLKKHHALIICSTLLDYFDPRGSHCHD